jgi:putative restriction endonuclease
VYGGQCAISRLPEPRPLDAAHIVMYADEQLGQPIVSNGLPLSKIPTSSNVPFIPRHPA